MSRYTEFTENNEVVWGKDHACGYFIQVFNLTDKYDDTPIVDLDSIFDNIDADRVVKIAEIYGVDPVRVSTTLDMGI